MSNDGAGRLVRAILFFAGIGAGVGAGIILAISAIAILIGDASLLGNVLQPLLAATGLGAVVGAAFASGVALLGRDETSGRLAHWKAALAGAVAGFVVPLVVMASALVVTGDLHTSLFDLALYWTEGTWWLLGLGASVGVGLNEVARRPQRTIGPGGEGEVPALTWVVPSGTDETG